MTRALALGLLALAGCAFDPKAEEAPPAGWPDADQDGYPADVDCDDQDAAINPTSGEGWWYPDGDGDGFGDAAGVAVCAGTAGAVADQTDCDDRDAQVNPAASEVCDEGLDNDCDGLADGDDPSLDPSSQALLYVDADGDGYGDPDRSKEACPPVDGAVEVGGDCDDSDADVGPDAEEICSDGRDNNCDGALDDCDLKGALSRSDADATLLGDALSEEAGWSVATPGDIDGDGVPDLLVGAPATLGTSKDVPNGAVWVVSGPFSGEGLLSEVATASLVGATLNEQAGRAVGGADFDLDGYADVVIGAPYAPVGGTGTWAGRIEFAYGPLEGVTRLGAASSDSYYGEKYDFAGYAVAVVGDMDEDGAPDVLLGSPGLDSGTAESEEGAVWLISQHDTEDYYLWSADYIVYGGRPRDYLGKAVAGAGDLDADGAPDLMFAAPYEDSEASDAGAVYFLYGPLPSDGTRHDLSLTDAADVRYGAAESDVAGVGLSSAGDVNGDGYDDVLIGAPGEYLDTDPPSEAAGKAHLLLGPINGLKSVYGAEATIANDEETGNLGTRVCGPGDVNGDGAPDLLVSIPYWDSGADDRGAALLYYGPVSGALSPSDADLRLLGEEGDRLGYSLAGADLNEDGFADLIIGGPGSDQEVESGGAVWLWYGRGL